jgi:hypothetical protein
MNLCIKITCLASFFYFSATWFLALIASNKLLNVNWLCQCSCWHSCNFFVLLCRTMRRYSPPYRSPPRRGYGGRGRSPPPRRGYGGRKEQGSCSLLVRNIPLSVRYITLACLSCLAFYNYDHDHIAVKKEANIFSPTSLLTSTFLTFEDRRIFEFLLKGLVLSGMFTFQRTIIVGKHYWITYSGALNTNNFAFCFTIWWEL